MVRKIDLHLISALFLLFIFNILDRSNIANARLGGIQTDLGLNDTQYQTTVAIMVRLFYFISIDANYGSIYRKLYWQIFQQFVGYLVGQIPSNIILTRVRPSRYIPAAIFVWGAISTCTAAVHNFTGIMLVRVLLGFAESPFFSGALYVH